MLNVNMITVYYLIHFAFILYQCEQWYSASVLSLQNLRAYLG